MVDCLITSVSTLSWISATVKCSKSCSEALRVPLLCFSCATASGHIARTGEYPVSLNCQCRLIARVGPQCARERGRQTLALVKKNVLLTLRNRRAFAVQLIVPIAFIAVLSLIK